MSLPIYNILFYFFSAALVGSSIVVVATNNPVKSVLFLILSFFASAILWMMLRAEFLSLVLIFVYVGAVMTLFMFVLMMTHFQGIFIKGGRHALMPFALLLFVILLGILCLALISSHLPGLSSMPHVFSSQYNNTQALGVLLFTHYIYPFEIAGAILLVAIVAAITLALHGPRQDAKRQDVNQQQEVTKSSRLKIIKMKADKL